MIVEFVFMLELTGQATVGSSLQNFPVLLDGWFIVYDCC